MGKWKYLNWLVILVILFFMFGALTDQYNAGVVTYLLVISAAIILTLTGYYIFIVKIRQNKTHVESSVQKPKPPKSVPTKRPKVVLKRKDNDKGK